MGSLAFCHLEGMGNDLYRICIYHNRNSLSSGNVEFKGGYIGFIPVKRVYIGTFVQAGLANMAKSSTV
jgi:hypothetical protein